MCRIQRVKWQVWELIFCVMVATPLGYKINIDKCTGCPPNTNFPLLEQLCVSPHYTKIKIWRPKKNEVDVMYENLKIYFK